MVWAQGSEPVDALDKVPAKCGIGGTGRTLNVRCARACEALDHRSATMLASRTFPAGPDEAPMC